MLAAIAGERVDKLPSFYMGTGEINARLASRLGVATDSVGLENRIGITLGAEVIFVRPLFSPRLDGAIGGFRKAEIHARIHEENGHKEITVPRGPLADLENVEQLPHIDCWPDPDSFAYSIGEDGRDYCLTHGVVARGNGALFLSAAALRGMEQSMTDMVLNAEMCHAILDRISALYDSYSYRESFTSSFSLPSTSRCDRIRRCS